MYSSVRCALSSSSQYMPRQKVARTKKEQKSPKFFLNNVDYSYVVQNTQWTKDNQDGVGERFFSFFFYRDQEKV